MTKKLKSPISRLFFSTASLLVFTILVVSCQEKRKNQKVLPFIGNYDLEYKMVDGKEVVDTIYPTIPYFYFRNQDSNIVTSKDLSGKIWIADFFFTTCPTICPTMTKNMKLLNDNLIDLKDEINFLSISINPDHDTPSKLKQYRDYYHIKNKNWQFLSGDETETHRLGIEDFKVFAGRDEMAEGGFAHSGAFTLIDKEGFVRGVYLGTDLKEVQRLEKDLRKLLKLEYGIKGSH